MNKLFESEKGNKIGVVFYGTDGYLVQATYTRSLVFDKDMKLVKEFRGGNQQVHFANFIDACQSRDPKQLNAGVREGHLSAGMSHLGNISYYLGEDNKVSVEEAKEILSRVKSLDDNVATLERTVQHLEKNGVDLAKYPLSMGPLFEVRSRKGNLPRFAPGDRDDLPPISRRFRLPERGRSLGLSRMMPANWVARG